MKTPKQKPFRVDVNWDEAEEKPFLVGISDGIVGSDLLGDCEHCRALPRGVKYYAYEGTFWCEYCVECL